MTNRILFYLCGWFLGWGGFCSCQHPDGVDPDGRVGQLVADAGITDRQLIKANEFNAALTAGGKKQASVYVYHRHTIVRYPGEKGARKLAARIVLMGYTDVLLSVHPQNGKSFAELANKAWIRIFNSYLNSHNVRVHALMFSEASQFDRAKNKEIYIHASVIQQYNRTVHANERFAGASADWEPHSLKPNSTLSSEANLLMLDRWNNDRYGKHAANDRLLKRTLEMLALAKFYLDEIGRVYHLPELSLNEAINYSFQERQNKDQLSFGDISQFITDGHCKDVNVMAYNHNKEEVWRRAQSNLAAADKGGHTNSVYICIKTRLGDDESDATSLKPQGWDYLIETFYYLHKQAAGYASMKGIVVYDYSDTEQMWLQQSSVAF